MDGRVIPGLNPGTGHDHQELRIAHFGIGHYAKAPNQFVTSSLCHAGATKKREILIPDEALPLSTRP
jgi:hypothetical protein